MSLSLDIRPATPDDVAAIFALIQALAEYERLSHQVTGTPAALAKDLFGDKACIEALVADYQGTIVGFALFFTNYSTFLTKPGVYLEDLFVLPEYRRRGIGKKLLQYLAQITQKRQGGRLEWTVLDWNQPAIAFYQQLGAEILPDWRICRVTGEALTRLSQGG